MDLKKNNQLNLEKRRSSLLFTGFAITLAIVLAGFEYKTFEIKPEQQAELSLNFMAEEEMISITLPKPPSLAPPPKPIIDKFIIDEKPIPEPIEPEVLPELKPITLDPNPTIIHIVGKEEVIDEKPIPYFMVEEMPTFPGGEKALHNYLRNQIKIPAMAKDARVNGKIFVEFTINELGAIQDVSLGNELGYGCDEVALKAIKNMPHWNPGKQQTKNVKVRMRIPIAFKTY